MITDNGKVDVNVPLDRQGTFEPQLIKKGQRRLEGFDEKVIAMYARGMTVRQIQGMCQYFCVWIGYGLVSLWPQLAEAKNRDPKRTAN